MKLPYLRVASGAKRERTVGQWGGLDERLIIEENCFHAMKNMSTRYFPAIATRLPRGESGKAFAGEPLAMAFKNGTIYTVAYWLKFDGTWKYTTSLFKDEQEVLELPEGGNHQRQIVGMGAYLCIFPDKAIYNTNSGEVSYMDATFAPSGTVTFEEVSTDSVFCKITAAGIDDVIKAHDGVTFYGVNDDAFLTEGKPATKVVTETGSDYIIVTAPIQETFSGNVTIKGNVDGDANVITLREVDSKFKPGDVVTITGSKDPDLNFQKITVKRNDKLPSGKFLHLVGTFPEKSYTQSVTITFSPYYSGSNLTRIYAEDLGDTFHEDDVVVIAGCSGSAVRYNGSFQVRQAGTNYILIDGALTDNILQASGITITRTHAVIEPVTIKRNSFTKTSGVQIKRESQDFDYVCEHDNRLWACNSSNHEIYASKLGDPTNWSCFEGISTDSYVATIGSDGVFTGCISYMGQVLFFKEDAIHMLYGNRPSNYQLSEMHMPGVKAGCSESLTIVDETLYYIGRNGVYRFNGAAPEKISEEITDILSSGIGATQDGKLYLSCVKGGERGGNAALLVYDPKHHVWTAEDDLNIQMMADNDNKIYFIEFDPEDLGIRLMSGDSDETIDWMIESGDLRESSLDLKWIGKLKFSLWLDADAEANIYLSYDEDPLWHRAGTVHSVTAKTYPIPIIPQRCSRFRWKMEGKGGMKLLAMAVDVEGGSEISGSIQSWFRR